MRSAIVLDEQRCVLCQRCVRFDDELTGERSRVAAERAVYTIIATESDRLYVSYFSGSTTELCPVGALTAKTYRFKARPWDTAGPLAADIRDLDRANVIVEIGADSAEQAPVLDLRVRYAAQHRGAALADVGHLPPNWPIGFRHFAADGDAGEILAAAAGTLREEEELAGDPRAQALGRLLRRAERVVVIWDGRDAAVANALEILIRALRDCDKHAGVLVVGHAPNARRCIGARSVE